MKGKSPKYAIFFYDMLLRRTSQMNIKIAELNDKVNNLTARVNALDHCTHCGNCDGACCHGDE